MSTEPTVAKKQLCSKTVHPSATESPAPKFQVHLKALFYDILPPSPSTGLPHPSSISKHWFTTCFLHPQALVYNILHPQALVYDILHLQALVYHILPPSPSTGLQYPPSPSTGLRHPSSISKHWFTTSFLHLQALVYQILHL